VVVGRRSSGGRGEGESYRQDRDRRQEGLRWCWCSVERGEGAPRVCVGCGGKGLDVCGGPRRVLATPSRTAGGARTKARLDERL